MHHISPSLSLVERDPFSPSKGSFRVFSYYQLERTTNSRGKVLGSRAHAENEMMAPVFASLEYCI